MPRFALVIMIVVVMGVGFWFGRASQDHVRNPGLVDSGADLRREIAEVKSAVVEMRRTITWLGERIRTTSATGSPSASGAAAVDCPATVGDMPMLPEEAAHAARTRNDGRFQQGEAIITASLDRGTWTGDDIEKFRALQRESPGPEWVWLMQRIDAAINEGKVKPDPSLPSWH